MNRRVILALIGVFAVGAIVGLTVAVATRDSSEPAAPSADDCAEAEAVVDGASERVNEIGASTTEQGPSFYAAILVEQRTITFAMDSNPTCFSLEDRAAAEGLLAGLQALVAVAEPAPGSVGSVPVAGSGDPGAGE